MYCLGFQMDLEYPVIVFLLNSNVLRILLFSLSFSSPANENGLK